MSQCDSSLSNSTNATSSLTDDEETSTVSASGYYVVSHEPQFVDPLWGISLAILCCVIISLIFLFVGILYWHKRGKKHKCNNLKSYMGVLITGIVMISIHSSYVATRFDFDDHDGWIWMTTILEFQLLFRMLFICC